MQWRVFGVFYGVFVQRWEAARGGTPPCLLAGGGHVARGERLLTHSMRSQQSVSTVLYLESNMCTDPNYGFLSKKYPTSQNYSQIVHTEALAAMPTLTT